jgi:hypothetical protein
MVVPLLPDEVAASWDLIGGGLERVMSSTVPVTKEHIANILHAVLSERAQCWGVYDEQGLQAVGLTITIFDPIMRTSSLLIYGIFSVREMQVAQWREMLAAFRQYAASYGIEAIVAYTNQRGVISLAERLGGSATMALLVFPINEAPTE